MREQVTGRKAEVLGWLSAYYSGCNAWPTSAELAEWERAGWPRTDDLLYVRRGLSDLQAAGLVESCGKRICRVSGKTCTVWRVVQR